MRNDFKTRPGAAVCAPPGGARGSPAKRNYRGTSLTRNPPLRGTPCKTHYRGTRGSLSKRHYRDNSLIITPLPRRTLT